MLKASGCFCPEYLLWACWHSLQGTGMGCRGVSPEALAACLLGAWLWLSSFSFVLWVSLPSTVQTKHRHLGTALGASRGSAEAALELWGWEHTKSLPVSAGTSFPAFQQVFGKELASSCVPAVPERVWALLSCHAGRDGGGSHPDISFPGCLWAFAACATILGQMGGGSVAQALARGCYKPSLQKTARNCMFPLPRQSLPPGSPDTVPALSLSHVSPEEGGWCPKSLAASQTCCLPLRLGAGRLGGRRHPPGAGQEQWDARAGRAWRWFACFLPAYPRDACSGPLLQKAPYFSPFRWPVMGTLVLLPSSTGHAAALTPRQHPPGLDSSPSPKSAQPVLLAVLGFAPAFYANLFIVFLLKSSKPWVAYGKLPWAASPWQDRVFPLFISDISMCDLQVKPTYMPNLSLCLPKGNPPKPEREAAAIILPASPRAGRRWMVSDMGWDALTGFAVTDLLVMQPACCLCDFAALSYNFQRFGQEQWGVIQQRFNFRFCLGEPAGSWLRSTLGF